jgi:Xaa-Pro aminopeptidase
LSDDLDTEGFPLIEIEQKLDRIRNWLNERKLDALYMQRVSNFAWATCGASSYVNIASTEGAASLLITQDKQLLFTNNIEAPRLEKDEKLVNQGWNFIVTPWHANQNSVIDLIKDLKVGSDSRFPGTVDVSTDLARLRANLTPQEVQGFRELGLRCAEAMDAAARVVQPGQTEHEIAGRLTGEVMGRGVQVIVNLIATDERIFSFRHPLPTFKTLERYAMLVLCGRQRGLVCSITRFIHFGLLPDNIQIKSKAVARIDAAMIAATRPGRCLGEIFQTGIDQYINTGFPDEWRLHHQGGPAGYEPREYFAFPGSTDLVSAGQVYAWNPSITGTKSEDTILVNEKGNEILTEISNWPKLTIDGMERPGILVI